MNTDAEVAILDYGVGNLGSISNMLRRLSISATIVTSANELESSRRVILPGVGAFDHGMQALSNRGLVESLRFVARRGTPLLGICLGMQLLAVGSAEGILPGLGLIEGRCVRFQSADKLIRIPHMGWNSIRVVGSPPLFRGFEETPRFYFTHSYHLEARGIDIIGVTAHGGEFASAIASGNVLGVQFHPEKSHRFGMQLLRNFSELPC